MQLVFVLLFALAAPASNPQEPKPAADAQSLTSDACELAIRRGGRWLCEQQAEDGSFAPGSPRDVCRLAISAMATWSLNEAEPRCIEPAAAERAARFLLSKRQPDGGIYDPTRGLAVYSTGVAVRALRTLGKRGDWEELAPTLAAAELFSYRHTAPESIVDAVAAGEVSLAHSAEVARELLRGAPSADESRRKALEFLARNKQDQPRPPSRLRTSNAPPDPSAIAPFSYDDLLPFVYFDLAPEQQLALRARAALTAFYTPDRNPDLTRRYGDAGFQQGNQGLFYYYFVVAKALSVFAQPVLVTADGVRHDWADEIGSRLVRMQHPDGSWANTDAVWWESEPVLATSYAVLTLKLCRASRLREAGKR